MIRNSFNRKTNLVSGKGMNWQALKAPAPSISKFRLPSMFDNMALASGEGPIPVKPVDKYKQYQGIVVYGKQAGTNLKIPVLLLKTRTCHRQVYTELPALSFDVITHRPLNPMEINLIPYEDVIANPYAPWDAVMVSGGIDFSFGGGTGGAVQLVFITKGPAKGLHAYLPAAINGNIGLSFSAGAVVGFVFYNKENIDPKTGKQIPLDAATFAGTSQAWSVGWGVNSISGVTAYTDNRWHVTDILSRKEADVLYEAVLGSSGPMSVPTDITFGAQYSFSRSKLWFSIPYCH